MIDAISSLTSTVRAPSSVSSASGTTSVLAARGTPAVDFAGILADVTSGAVNSLKQGEAMAITGIQGKASVQNVVEAILSAEQSLQTALAVRDKAVAAYQEISRMAI